MSGKVRYIRLDKSIPSGITLKRLTTGSRSNDTFVNCEYVSNMDAQRQDMTKMKGTFT